MKKAQVLKKINPNPSSLLVVHATLVETVKSLNDFTQPLVAMAEIQRKFVEDFQAIAVAPLKQLTQIVEVTALSARAFQNSLNIKPLLTDFASFLPKQNTIAEAVQSGFKMAEIFKPLDLSYFTEPFSNISEWVKSLIPPEGLFNGISKIITTTLDTFNNFISSIKDALRNAIEPIYRLIKSNYLFIVYASKGDKMALNHLGRIWWKLGKRYSEIERLRGRQPNKQEFEQLVQEVCWEVLNEMEKRDTSWLEAARIVFFAISTKLFVDYVEITQNERLTEVTEVKVLHKTYKSGPNIYLHENDKPSLFIKTVAQELGVSTQTVRNWIKSEQITGIKVSYFSRLRQAIVPVYLLPYQPNLLTKLKAIKSIQDKRKRHQLEGYFTVSQVASWYNLSRKTLERWDKEGKLVPKRIDSIRYYTEAQKEEVKNILLNSQNPKIKKLLASYRLSY